MEVVPGIRLLKVPIPDNPLEYVNAYLIEGDGQYALVDPGWPDGEALSALKKQLAEIGLDIEGNPISKEHARKIIFAKYRVPEDIRRERRRRNSKVSKDRETATYRTNEAAKAPQPVEVMAISRKQV